MLHCIVIGTSTRPAINKPSSFDDWDVVEIPTYSFILIESMNANPHQDIRERYKYDFEIYIDSEPQVISTRAKQKPSVLRTDHIDVNSLSP